MSERPASVLVVTPRYLPEMGGVESHVQQVLARLKQQFDVQVVTTDNGIGLPPRDVVDGVPVSRIPAYPRGRDWRFAPGVLREIRAGRADLVHCQGVHTFVPVLAMLAAVWSRTPYLVSFHTGGHSSRARSRIRDVQWRVLKPLLSRATKLVCVAEFERAYFARLLGLPLDRFAVIPNGGELPAPREGVGVVPHRIISVGRLERYKGHHRLVRAMSRVRQELPDAELLIVGGGPDEDDLRREVRSRGLDDAVHVTSVPPGDRGAMADLLASAAVFALMSDYEAHPLAVMEAVALGLPAVVTYTSGLAELVDRGLATAVPLNADDDAVATALVRQLCDPRPPAVKVTPPTWDDAAASLALVYRSTLDGRD
jgi:glycosyltransferase involved in cell wall biosynthesis